MVNNIPWVLSYTPTKIEESIIHTKELELLKAFALNFKKAKKRAYMIYGPTGIGKTTCAHLLAKSLGYEILELNASDARDKKSIDSVIGIASRQQSLFFQGKIILVDEADGISGRYDRGGIKQISNLIKETSFPIIVTCSDPWDSKMSDLRKVCNMLELKDITQDQTKQILSNIVKNENLKITQEQINSFTRRCDNDLRAAINDFQSLCVNDNFTKEDLENISDRNKIISMPKTLQLIFKSKDFDILNKAFSETSENFDETFMWLDENISREYESAEDICSAHDYLSKADVFRGRIRRRQHWRFLAYINTLLGVGIGLSKKEKYNKFVQYKPTSRILSMWITNRKNTKRNAISEKIAHNVHSSKKDIIKNFKFYKQISAKKEYLDNMKDELDFDKDEIAFLNK